MTPVSPESERVSSTPWVLVCQGGGGKGAWQAGFIDEAVRQFGLDFKTCIGTSVGALNCTLYLQSLMSTHTDIFASVWRSTGVFDILCRPTIREIFRGGISGHARLLNLMHRSVRRGDVERVCLTRDKYLIVFTSTEGSSRPFIFGPPPPLGSGRSHDGFNSLYAALLASSAIPLVFPYVQQDVLEHVDGGTKNNNPMETALGLGVDEILVLSPTRREALTARRTLVEYIDPIHTQLLRSAHRVQDRLRELSGQSAALQGAGPPPRVYFVTPSETIPSRRTIVFSRETSQQLFEMGRRDAQVFFGAYRAGASTYDLSTMPLIPLSTATPTPIPAPAVRRPPSMVNILGLTLNIVGSVLLAFAIKIAPATEIYGQAGRMELGGKEVQLATASPGLFHWGLALLVMGFVSSLVSEIRARWK